MEGLSPIKAQAPIFAKRATCRACYDGGLEEVLNLGVQYLPRYLDQIDLASPRAPLRLMRCAACGLLQLGDTVQADELFRKFWYRSSVNRTMRDAMCDLVEAGLAFHRSGTWVDIGANDGYLLSQVPSRFTRIAVEPAENFVPELQEHYDFVIPDYFSANHERLRNCEVITSAAMFYDLDDPGAFVADIAKCLARDGVWINQLNDAPTTIEANAFDSICHEHLCYYDLGTLKNLYRQHGLVIVKVQHNAVNGGSIRVFAKHSGVPTDILGSRSVRLADVQAFARRVMKWKERMGDLMRGTLAYRGPLWCYGASTKGSVLLQYLGAERLVIGAADRNPAKVGKLMAGTWIPITDEATMRKSKPDYLLVLPWSRDFVREFLNREAEILKAGTTFILPLPNPELLL